MRIVVIGAGGVGGVFGGQLARAGKDVWFIARGAHLAALRSQGLTVQSEELGDFSWAVNATDEPSEIGHADVIMVCVKSYDLDTAAAIIRPLIRPETIVLPLQNGIDSAERLSRVLGSSHLIGGVAYVVAWIASPGVIVHIGANRLVLGELHGKPTRRTEQLHQALEDAGIMAVLHPDICVALWEKFVLMAAMGGGGALTRLPFGIIRANAETSELFRLAMEETVAVGRAHGIALPADCIEQHWSRLRGLDGAARSSMTNDLAAGRRLELEAINGTVIRLGREHNVPTPVNFVIYAALKPYADGTPVQP